MSEHALMKKGEATMNVPPDKVQAYLADGWTVIQAPEPSKAEAPRAAAAEEAPAPEKKTRGKK